MIREFLNYEIVIFCTLSQKTLVGHELVCHFFCFGRPVFSFKGGLDSNLEAEVTNYAHCHRVLHLYLATHLSTTVGTISIAALRQKLRFFRGPELLTQM
jgi:hypothetical protein